MRTLLIEDDKGLCEATKLQLEKTRYEIGRCGSGQEAFYYAAEFPYDVILLDWMLLQTNGLNVFNGLRRMGVAVPVIVTTALDGISGRVDDLDTGANDYLVKPYAPGELLARVCAVTRRPGKLESTRAKAYSSIGLDPEKRELTGLSGMAQLSKREPALVEYLIRNAGQILTRGMILSYTQGSDSRVEERNLGNCVYFLRRHLESVNGAAQIKAIHGTGHRLEVGGNP